MRLQAEGRLGGFKYEINKRTLSKFKKDLAKELAYTFREGIINPPKTGRKYPSLPNRSSRAHEFPANQKGALLRSVRSSYTKDSVTVGSNKYYAKFLATGTVRMEPRKMSRYVLQAANKTLPVWIAIRRRGAR